MGPAVEEVRNSVPDEQDADADERDDAENHGEGAVRPIKADVHTHIMVRRSKRRHKGAADRRESVRFERTLLRMFEMFSRH